MFHIIYTLNKLEKNKKLKDYLTYGKKMNINNFLENKVSLHESYIKKLSINKEGFNIQLDNVTILDNFERGCV